MLEAGVRLEHIDVNYHDKHSITLHYLLLDPTQPLPASEFALIINFHRT
jgi:hypothetical protein